MDLVLFDTALGVLVVLFGTVWQFFDARKDLALASERNAAAVALVPKFRLWNVRQHIREWRKITDQADREVQEDIASYRRKMVGWFLLLVGNALVFAVSLLGSVHMI